MKSTLLSLLILLSLPISSTAQEVDFRVSDLPKDMNEMLRAQLIVQKYREKYLARYEHLPIENQERQAKKAADMFKKGVKLLERDIFSEAHYMFESAERLDPRQDDYFYAHGICLFKMSKFRRSLAYLNTLEGSNINQTELNYYQGLNYMGREEDEQAYAKFVDVRDRSDEVLSPLAALYAGSLASKREDFSDARKNYEFVLDNSKNPKVDQKAEAGLEQVSRSEQFQEMAKVKWGYSIFAGAMYDENVLNVAQQNQTTSAKAYRMVYGGTVAYRAIFRQKYNFLPQFNFTDIYSFDSQFKSDPTIQSTDPQQLEISGPYRRQVSIFGTPATLLVSPAYSHLYMSITEDGRKLIFDSAYLVTSLTMSHFSNWLSDYRLEASHDNYNIATASPDDDQTAMKYTLATSQTYLFDATGRKSASFDVVYYINDANGRNSAYDKYILSLGGNYPLSETWLGYGRLDYINMNYSDSVLGRKDTGITTTLGAFLNINRNNSVNMNAQYYMNDSSVSAYEYDKLVVNLMYVYRGGFL